MSLETPKYELLEKDAKFEIRRYAQYITASVTLNELEFEQASNQGFRLIADYIFGNNTKRNEIAMTAPVIQKQIPQPQSEKIAMTAPVNFTKTDANSYQVSFVMPSEYTLETLPEPNNIKVVLGTVPPATLAVIMFSGMTNEKRVAEKTSELKAWIVAKELTTSGEPSLARYSPPYVPRMLRKNEISIELVDYS